ncbi:unnamed protein product [Blepharisma stoltei]|uniref:PX domain-containing protein n=1 Tax=Blepharisma stoltei TaxID=1481888 RepID=A0AAU9JJK0_9CILI|nr:unnamed protein product [Blepharisma stoltei]
MEAVDDIVDIPLHGGYETYNSSSGRTSASNQGIEIYITNSTLKDDTFSKYISYWIQGHDSSGNFQVYRRYSDFLALRTQLIQKWPGCYIPPVPPKQLIGNLSSKFIEARRKQLEYFLQTTSAINFIYVTEEFQLFIRNQTEFERASDSFRISNREISQTYQNLFMDFTRSQVTLEMKRKLDDYDEFFKNSHNVLSTFKKSVKSVGIQFHVFQSQFCDLNTKLKELEKGYIKELREYENVLYVPIEKRSLENPFLELYDWAKQEAQDIKSILEALASRTGIEAQKLKAEKRMEKESKSLKKIQQGKSTFTQIFSSTTKTEQLASAEVQIKDIEDEIKDLETILRIIMIRLCEYELPIFKANKIKTYERMMKKYAELTVSGFKIITDSAKGIQERMGEQ